MKKGLIIHKDQKNVICTKTGTEYQVQLNCLYNFVWIAYICVYIQLGF